MNHSIPSEISASYIQNKTQELATQLTQTRFWWVGEGEENNGLMIYDSQTDLLWMANPNQGTYNTLTAAHTQAEQTSLCGFKTWRLPMPEEILAFAQGDKNPLQTGIKSRLLETNYWMTTRGGINLDNGNHGNIKSTASAPFIACNAFFRKKSASEFIQYVLQKNWWLSSCSAQKITDLLKEIRHPSLKEVYQSIDYASARLPKIEASQFTDINKGMWEFWGMDTALLKEHQVRARNPVLDVKDCNVAIDFGTSSTVVAYDDNDQHKLLRIGVQDYWAKEQPSDYENPTVLEFIDFHAMLEDWNRVAYRPGVMWGQVCCSHEAQTHFRNHKNDPKSVSSILTRLKQWALREGKPGQRIRITDLKGYEHELEPLSLRVPVKGQKMEVKAEDSFDPIELYAWFLGLTINWRGRGIFLRYYLTFPVAYPREVKDKILASFQRGLQRSLPPSLIEQEVFQDFQVEERASEPTAYAAVALQYLDIKPTTEGVAYAVFDFGGGTADFDYGYYRLPTAEEADEEGKELVLEHYETAGDRFLGGENLLENMAYRVFRHNLDECRKNKIAFTRPLDADDFPGSEMFLESTQAATSNTVMLMTALRPLWETGKLPDKLSTGMLTLDILNRESQKVPCQLTIDENALTTYLKDRITQGVKNFLAALKKAFADTQPQEIHILLAGNSSRSDVVKGLFEQEEKSASGEECSPRIKVHPPLPMCNDDPYRPTAKTGVALGLLHLCPGGVIKVIPRTEKFSGNEAPFLHYVGRIRQGKFQAGINQGSAYNTWHELGVPSERVFNLYHTQSPKAHTGEMQQGEAGLFKQRIDLAGNTTGYKVFARIIGPSAIELCTARSLDDIKQDESRCDNLRELKLG